MKLDINLVRQLCENIPDGMYFEENLNGPDFICCKYCDNECQVNYRDNGRGAVQKAKESFTHYSDCSYVLAQEILKGLNE